MSNENCLEALKRWREDGGERKTPWEKYREKPSSRALAMKCKCYECMGWGVGEERPPGIQTDIKNCSAKHCPLHSFRPYK